MTEQDRRRMPMPRNEIALIVGLVVALIVMFARPGPGGRLPRTAQGYLSVLFVFCVAFLITWIILRLLGI